MTPPRDASATGTRRGAVSSGAVLFLGLMAFYACFHQARDWNSASRLMLTYALVQRGTIEITDFVAQDGRLLKDPQTRDLSSRGDGRYYCDKAPGQSFLGTLPYWLTRHLGLVEPHPLAAPVIARWPADYWVTLLTSGALTAATAVILWWFLLRLGSTAWGALATALAFGVSTIALPYATMFYGHAAAACLSLLSLFLFFRTPRSTIAALAAGWLAGLAVVVEYPQAIFPFVLLAVTATALFGPARGKRFGDWVAFLLGGLSLVPVLAAYHQQVTGSPFRVPYTLEVEEELFGYHKEGYGIPIHAPSAAVMQELLLGRRRGLLWYSPVVLGAVPGLVLLARRQVSMALVCLGTFLGLFLINAGFPTWDGGWATGPRFLLPAIPFLLLPTGVWLGTQSPPSVLGWLNRLAKAAWLTAAAISALILTAFTTAGVNVPPVQHPLRDWLIPALKFQQETWTVGRWLLDQLGLRPATGFPAVALNCAIGAGLVALMIGIIRRLQPRAGQQQGTGLAIVATGASINQGSS